jgi:thymidine kinase
MIHLYLGPMYAGKTTKLLNLYLEKGGQILDYADMDETPGTLVTHDDEPAPCMKLSHLHRYTGNAQILYINEAQFFPDLLDFVKKNESLTLYLFGLDGDFQRNPIGQILQIIPLCDTVEKLKGKCQQCSNPSVFSKRITKDQQQILLDANAYIPLCRSCYLNYKDFL